MSWRVAIAVAVIGPLEVLLGMPFPTGLRIVAKEAPTLVPWAWGVNGFCTVIGSVGAMILAMVFGFRIVLAGSRFTGSFPAGATPTPRGRPVSRVAPAFIHRGCGCHVWDLDGNEFIEYGMGLRAVTLGHAYPAVLDAVRRQLELGTNFTRPSPIEVECAEAVLGVIEGADQIKFTKDGSTATTAAVKLARAYTGRDLVAFCGDHRFFSYDDWLIGKTAMNAGIPQGCLGSLADLPLQRHSRACAQLFVEHPGEIACLIMEPARDRSPPDGFLHKTDGALPPQRGGLHPRREHHRVSLAPWRRPEVLRHRSRSVGLRQSDEQRIRVVGPRRQA